MKCRLLHRAKWNCRSVAVSPSCSPATRLGKVTKEYVAALYQLTATEKRNEART